MRLSRLCQMRCIDIVDCIKKEKSTTDSPYWRIPSDGDEILMGRCLQRGKMISYDTSLCRLYKLAKKILEIYLGGEVVASTMPLPCNAFRFSTPCVRASGAQWRPVCVTDRDTVEPLAVRTVVWVRGDLLASSRRMAEGRRLEQAACIARRVARIRTTGSLICCRRFIVGTSRWGGRKTGPIPTDRARFGSNHHV